MTTELMFTVHGTPAPQGSKRHVGHGVMIESSKRVKPWREAVKWAALVAITNHADLTQTDWQPITGPVFVRAVFHFPRPKAHYRTGGNAHLLRDDAPMFVNRTPDLDKVLRSTFDAITESGVWRDDAQVAEVQALKLYATSTPLALIRVVNLDALAADVHHAIEDVAVAGELL